MWVNTQFYAEMFTFTKYILNKEVHFLCIDLCKLTENYCEDENNLFFEKYVAFNSDFSKKSLQFANFYHSVFRCKVLRPFVFYWFEVQSTVLASSSSQGGNMLI